jgi:ATP-dependent RNA helicase DeaD
MNDFASTGLKPEVLSALAEIGFVKPTQIQEAAIPQLLTSGQDLIGLAATGTGKTAAFSLPIVHHVDPNNRHIQAIILCPTRELCLQITKDIKNFTAHLPQIRTVSVYGGESIEKQIRLLERGAHIVVGTPGRVCDMLRRKRLIIDSVSWVVLDEADEMLSMGFKEDMEFILRYTPENRQTVMFSATMPREIEGITKEFMQDAARIEVQRANKSAANVEHEYYLVNARDRYAALRRIADLNPNIYAIVFCRTRRDTKEIAAQLLDDGYNADALHGDLSQAQRDLVMQRFRDKHLQILVATDVAARGIDVDVLTHVINMGFPDNEDAYIHRSGRTGRAGNLGISISIINRKELRRVRFFEKKTGKTFQKREVPTAAEVTEKQLFHYLEKIEQAPALNSDLLPFLPKVYEKMESLSKEDLIKNLVSLEFHQMLKDYQEATDLNIEAKPSREERRKHKKERRKNERKDNRKFSTESGFVRLYLNAGRQQNINPGRIISLINKVPGMRDAEIGRIDLHDSYTAVDVDLQYEDILLSRYKSTQISGVKTYFSHSKPSGAKSSYKSKKKDFKKSKKKKKSYSNKY